MATTLELPVADDIQVYRKLSVQIDNSLTYIPNLIQKPLQSGKLRVTNQPENSFNKTKSAMKKRSGFNINSKKMESEDVKHCMTPIRFEEHLTKGNIADNFSVDSDEKNQLKRICEDSEEGLIPEVKVKAPSRYSSGV